MRDADYEDELGRKFRVTVPDDWPDTELASGLLKGPPPELVDQLEANGWKQSAAVALHNELHRRGIFTARDAMLSLQALEGALKRVLRTDMQTIQTVYFEGGK